MCSPIGMKNGGSVYLLFQSSWTAHFGVTFESDLT
jgi:hypothetical protein